MKKELKDNELIAEFMGATPCKIDVKSIGIVDGYECDEFKLAIDELEYNSSWDWLMPVVEKISGLVPRAFERSLDIGPLSPLAELRINSTISEVYKAIVEFIEWYNENVKP